MTSQDKYKNTDFREKFSKNIREKSRTPSSLEGIPYPQGTPGKTDRIRLQ